MTRKRGQITVIIAVGILQAVEVQIMYPVQQPVYMMPPPQQVAVPMPFPVAVPYRVTQKPTTTTTTQEPESEKRGIGIPIAIPMPVPYAVPAAPPPLFCVKPRTPGCPPCPPCSCKPICTPAFFSYCSPCHQMCRCRYNEAPLPLPPVPAMPAYAPPPVPAVVMVPFPSPPSHLHPEQRDSDRKYVSSVEDRRAYNTYEHTSSELPSSGDTVRLKKRYRHKKLSKKRRIRIKNYRKFLSEPETSDTDDNVSVKPVLAYISKHGDVVFRKRINKDDAARLMSKDVPFNSKEQLNNKKSSRRVAQTNERKKKTQDKEVVFKTPPNKRFNNLSISFSLV